MKEPEIRVAVLRCLEAAVPGADVTSLDPSLDVREQLDMDSMDLLRFARSLHDRLHVEIPEVDNVRLTTVDSAVAYLAEKVRD